MRKNQKDKNQQILKRGLMNRFTKKMGRTCKGHMEHRDTSGRPAEELQAQEQIIDQFLGL